MSAPNIPGFYGGILGNPVIADTTPPTSSDLEGLYGFNRNPDGDSLTSTATYSTAFTYTVLANTILTEIIVIPTVLPLNLNIGTTSGGFDLVSDLTINNPPYNTYDIRLNYQPTVDTTIYISGLTNSTTFEFYTK